MAGHNKWSKIKRKKGVNDAKKGKQFSRLAKEITVSVKEGGTNDPDFNPRLRLAINNAKGINMPKENIERAIKKATEAGGEAFLEMNYEGYAPGGVAVYVECLSDNQKRTVAHIRAIFNKCNGSLATSGSVAFLFDRKGAFEFPQGDWQEEELAMELIDAGAEEVELEDGIFSVSTDYGDFGNMNKKLEDLKIEVTNAELVRIPTTSTKVDVYTAKQVLRLLDLIEDDDDVQMAFHNMELTPEVEQMLEA